MVNTVLTVHREDHPKSQARARQMGVTLASTVSLMRVKFVSYQASHIKKYDFIKIATNGDHRILILSLLEPLPTYGYALCDKLM